MTTKAKMVMNAAVLATAADFTYGSNHGESRQYSQAASTYPKIAPASEKASKKMPCAAATSTETAMTATMAQSIADINNPLT